MAEKINGYSFPRSRGGGSSVYPWDTWEDGSVWKIMEGADYAISTDVMVACVYKRAWQNRKKGRGMPFVRATKDGTAIIFQFLADKPE